MLFNSVEYLFVFIPIVFTVYFLLNKFKFYNVAKFFLLFASLFFYGAYKWDYLSIIVVSILFNYGISFCFKLNIAEAFKKGILIFGVFANIFILFLFKYFDFLAYTFKNFDWFNFNTLRFLLPLGVSFFTIQEISYIVDCYKQRVKQYNLLDFSLFISFFPQLVAGPIVRHQEMIPQFNNLKNRAINQDNIFIGIFLITVGLLKKTVFADTFNSFIGYVIESHTYSDFGVAWMLGIFKVLQGFFDFSGYCDLAMGSAFLFNISLPWNFNSPFKAVSIMDFWKRWNMSFVRFLIDYIYKPLGGQKEGVIKTLRNVMITFLVLGLWQGGNLMAVLYGVFNGLLICINYLWQKLNLHMNKIIARVLTLIAVIFSTQMLFTSGLNDYKLLVKSMFGIGAEFHGVCMQGVDMVFQLPPPHNAQINLIVLVFALYFVLFSKNSMQLARIYAKSNNVFYTFILVLVFVFATLSITKSTDFIYFAF